MNSHCSLAVYPPQIFLLKNSHCSLAVYPPQIFLLLIFILQLPTILIRISNIQSQLKKMIRKLSIPFKTSVNILCFGQSNRLNFSTQFPYNLGGVRYSDPNNSFFWKFQLCQGIFGKQFGQNLINAYRSTINAIHENDYQFIQEIMEPNLASKFIESFPKKLKLLNPDSKVDMFIGNIDFIFYLPFLRGKVDDYELETYKSNDALRQLDIKIFGANTTHPQLLKKSDKTLFAIQIYFRSQMKLVQDDQDAVLQTQNEENVSNEYHMIQFELQNNFDPNKLSMKILRIFFRNLKFSFRQPLKKQAALQSMAALIGIDEGQYQWKIGDFDGFLKGNLPPIINK